ncbi:MAG: rRNA large subunit methyltransferase I, partial [Bacteroidetes bacterium]|nr:rRNA large subunit methyltransferase I [Bacteroidota bacterium]
MTKVYLKRKISRRVENGHPWIFGNEIDKVEGDTAGASIVDVFTFDKKFMGRGYINLQSQIAVR